MAQQVTNDTNNGWEQERQRPELRWEMPSRGASGVFGWIWVAIIVVVFLWLLGWGLGAHGWPGWGGNRQAVAQPVQII